MLLDVTPAGNIKHSQLGKSPFQNDTQLCPKGPQDWTCDVASVTPKCGVLREITPMNIVNVGDSKCSMSLWHSLFYSHETGTQTPLGTTFSLNAPGMSVSFS